MKALLEDDAPPPPLLVPAARELSRFGWAWVTVGLFLAAAAPLTGAARELDSAELALILIFIGLSIASVLGALLLARRTGPEILYYRILDYAPPPPSAVPRETPGATTRRVIPPALTLVLGLIALGIVATTAVLLLGGQPRAGVADDVPAGTLLFAGAWTFVCGAAALRIAAYFTRWQRRRTAVVWCRPLKAGTMRPVYWVE